MMNMNLTGFDLISTFIELKTTLIDLKLTCSHFQFTLRHSKSPIIYMKWAKRKLNLATMQAKLTSIQLKRTQTIAHRHCERSEAISQFNRLLQSCLLRNDAPIPENRHRERSVAIQSSRLLRRASSQ
jgi:hypothetical protein